MSSELKNLICIGAASYEAARSANVALAGAEDAIERLFHREALNGQIYTLLECMKGMTYSFCCKLLDKMFYDYGSTWLTEDIVKALLPAYTWLELEPSATCQDPKPILEMLYRIETGFAEYFARDDRPYNERYYLIIHEEEFFGIINKAQRIRKREKRKVKRGNSDL